MDEDKKRMRVRNDMPDDGPPSERAMQQQRRRQELLAASKKVLSQGHAEFSMRKVAALAGVNLNTVQYHFGDAQGLIESTVRSTIYEYIDAFRNFAKVDYESPTENLIALLDLGFIGLRNPTLRKFFVESWTLGLHNPIIGNLLRSCYADYQKTVLEIIKKINPNLTDSDLNTLSCLIVAWGEGILVMAEWSDINSPSISMLGEQVKKTCIDMITKGGTC